MRDRCASCRSCLARLPPSARSRASKHAPATQPAQPPSHPSAPACLPQSVSNSTETENPSRGLPLDQLTQAISCFCTFATVRFEFKNRCQPLVELLPAQAFLSDLAIFLLLHVCHTPFRAQEPLAAIASRWRQEFLFHLGSAWSARSSPGGSPSSFPVAARLPQSVSNSACSVVGCKASKRQLLAAPVGSKRQLLAVPGMC